MQTDDFSEETCWTQRKVRVGTWLVGPEVEKSLLQQAQIRRR